MNKYDIQIQELNSYVKTRIAPSKIHGVGIHAIINLKKGEKLYADMTPRVYNLPYTSFNKLFPEVKHLILEQWPNIINGSNFAWPTTRLQGHMNHGGEESNYNAQKDILLKDVKEGEEVTENYCLIPNATKIYLWLKCTNVSSPIAPILTKTKKWMHTTAPHA